MGLQFSKNINEDPTTIVLAPAEAAGLPDSWLAARKRDAHHLDQIADNLARTRRSLGDIPTLVTLDIEFHSLVAQAAANRAMELAREALGQLFYPAFRSVLTGVEVAGARLLAAHEAIAQAIRDTDVETARKWMERHIIDFRKGYELAGFDIARPAQATAEGDGWKI